MQTQKIRQNLFDLLQYYALYNVPCNMAATDWLDAVLDAGFRTIQVRDKNRVLGLNVLQAMVRRAERRDAIVLINDWVDLAEGAGAHGVHLGPDDADLAAVRKQHKDWVIGASARDAATAVRAFQAGADYLGVGPVCATDTKENLPAPIGWAGFDAVAQATPLPCVAIGGLCSEDCGPGCGSDRAIGLAFCAAAADAEGIARLKKVISDFRH